MITFREFVNQCLAESGFEDPFEKGSNVDRIERGEPRFKSPPVHHSVYYALYNIPNSTFLTKTGNWTAYDLKDSMRWGTEAEARKAFETIFDEALKTTEEVIRRWPNQNRHRKLPKREDFRIRSYPLGSADFLDVMSDEPA